MNVFIVIIAILSLCLASEATVTPTPRAGITTSSPVPVGNVSYQLTVLLNRVAELENQTHVCSYQIAEFQATLNAVLAKIKCEFAFNSSN